FQDKRRLGCDRAEKAIAGRNLLFTPNGAAYKRFPRSAGQQRESQAVQFLESRDQRIILIETLAEAEPGVEHDVSTLQSGRNRYPRPLFQFGLNQGDDIFGWRQNAPLLWASAHVHEHGPALEISQRTDHLRVPVESADVVHDFRAGIYRSASHRRFVRVHGNYSGRASLLEIGDDRNDALQLRFGTHGWSRAEMFGVNTFGRFDPGSRTCRLSADVDNICALIH